MTADKIHQDVLKAMAQVKEHDATIILSLAQQVGLDGQRILYHAYVHLYAAVFCDFVKQAKAALIGPAVDMKDGTIKHTEDFLVDTMFDKYFPRLERDEASKDFLLELKYRVKKTLQLI